MQHIPESEFGYSEPLETKPSNIVRHGLKRFRKGSQGEIEWLSKAVGHAQTKEAVETLYQQIPEVNLITQKRFAQLGLWQPTVLTAKNLFLFSKEEFTFYTDEEHKRDSHPVFLRYQESFKEEVKNPVPATAFKKGDCVYWDLDEWLQNPNWRQEVDETLYHEDTHRQCKRRYLQGVEAYDMGRALIVGLTALSKMMFEKDPASEELFAFDNYLSYIIDAFNSNHLEFYQEGACVFIMENGLVLYKGGEGLNEAIVYREADRAVGSEAIYNLEEDLTEEDLFLKERFIEHDNLITQLEGRHGEKEVMKAYFSSNIYHLILKDLPTNERFPALADLLFQIL